MLFTALSSAHIHFIFIMESQRAESSERVYRTTKRGVEVEVCGQDQKGDFKGFVRKKINECGVYVYLDAFSNNEPAINMLFFFR